MPVNKVGQESSREVKVTVTMMTNHVAPAGLGCGKLGITCSARLVGGQWFALAGLAREIYGFRMSFA